MIPNSLPTEVSTQVPALTSGRMIPNSLPTEVSTQVPALTTGRMIPNSLPTEVSTQVPVDQFVVERMKHTSDPCYGPYIENPLFGDFMLL